eukprot:CAMPEP_0181506922 /NCGR_PEP_ID=MMETSP1110-20121109/58857_1 /TAXON_ID=174948 /ORGANISM="Symbiodinium sp., Strain CCMP421" /LENGTH=142 /DNA_ID=CAMNT_0023636021 /DNA_START=77 /DNA_END=505 /DNA_ORIENTATION=+
MRAEAPPAYRASGFAPAGYESRLKEEGAPVEIKGFLEEALVKAKLEDRAADVREWCDEQGAELLQEVLEELDTLAEDLDLDSAVATRLANAIMQTQQSAREDMKKREKAAREGMATLGHKLISGQVSLEAVQEAYGAMDQKT